MTEYPNHRPCDTETPSHKISNHKYYEKWGMIDKIKHEPSMLQPCTRHTRITTPLSLTIKIIFTNLTKLDRFTKT